MRQALRSDDIIEALVMLNCGEAASAQAKALYRESLRSLVRLAQCECRIEQNLARAVHAGAWLDKRKLH